MTPQGKMKKAVFLYNFTPLALNDWLADGWPMAGRVSAWTRSTRQASALIR